MPVNRERFKRLLSKRAWPPWVLTTAVIWFWKAIGVTSNIVFLKQEFKPMAGFISQHLDLVFTVCGFIWLAVLVLEPQAKRIEIKDVFVPNLRASECLVETSSYVEPNKIDPSGSTHQVAYANFLNSGERRLREIGLHLPGILLGVVRLLARTAGNFMVQLWSSYGPLILPEAY